MVNTFCDLDTLGGGWTLCAKYDRDASSSPEDPPPLLGEGFGRSRVNADDMATLKTFSSSGMASIDCRLFLPTPAPSQAPTPVPSSATRTPTTSAYDCAAENYESRLYLPENSGTWVQADIPNGGCCAAGAYADMLDGGHDQMPIGGEGHTQRHTQLDVRDKEACNSICLENEECTRWTYGEEPGFPTYRKCFLLSEHTPPEAAPEPDRYEGGAYESDCVGGKLLNQVSLNASWHLSQNSSSDPLAGGEAFEWPSYHGVLSGNGNGNTAQYVAGTVGVGAFPNNDLGPWEECPTAALSAPAAVVAYRVTYRRQSWHHGAPRRWTLSGSNDGGQTWDVLDTRCAFPSDDGAACGADTMKWGGRRGADTQTGLEEPFVVQSPGAYSLYQFSNWTGGRNYLTDITLYSLDEGGTDAADVRKGVCELLKNGRVASDCCVSGTVCDTEPYHYYLAPRNGACPEGEEVLTGKGCEAAFEELGIEPTAVVYHRPTGNKYVRPPPLLLFCMRAREERMRGSHTRPRNSNTGTRTRAPTLLAWAAPLTLATGR